MPHSNRFSLLRSGLAWSLLCDPDKVASGVEAHEPFFARDVDPKVVAVLAQKILDCLPRSRSVLGVDRMAADVGVLDDEVLSNAHERRVSAQLAQHMAAA